MEKNLPYTSRLVQAQSDLYAYVSAMLPFHKDAVADIVQETNLALLSKESSFDPSRPFMPWAIAFAKRQVKGYLTCAGRERVLFASDLIDELSEIYPDEHSVGTEDSGSDLLARLRSCRQKLKARDRLLIDLFYDRELPVHEIAHQLKRKDQSVRFALSSVRKKLGHCIRALCRLSDDDGKPGTRRPIDEAVDAAIEDDKPSGCLLRRAAAEFAGLDSEARLEVLDQFRVDSLLRGGMVAAAHKTEPRRSSHGLLKIAAGLAAFAAMLSLAALWRGGAFSLPADTQATVSPGVVAPGPDGSAASSIASAAPSPTALAAIPGTNATLSATAQAALTKETQGESNMRTNTLTRGAVAALALSAAATPPLVQSSGATDVLSAETRMVFAPETNSAWSIYWQTAFTNVVPICWGACPKAASAHLTASCMNFPAVTADFSAADTNAAWRIPAGTDEDLYTIELRYLNAEGGMLLAVTSCVARIVGLNGAAGVMDFAATDETNTEITAWSKIRRPGATVDNTVIAYDTARDSTNSIGSAVFTAKPLEFPSKTTYASIYAQAGYIGWQLAGQGMPVGWYAVSLEFDDGTLLYQKVYRSPGGTIYSFR